MQKSENMKVPHSAFVKNTKISYKEVIKVQKTRGYIKPILKLDYSTDCSKREFSLNNKT